MRQILKLKNCERVGRVIFYNAKGLMRLAYKKKDRIRSAFVTAYSRQLLESTLFMLCVVHNCLPSSFFQCVRIYASYFRLSPGTIFGRWTHPVAAEAASWLVPGQVSM